MQLKEALQLYFQVALPDETIAVEQYHSFRPAGSTKAVKASPARFDDVLLNSTEVPPWARLTGLYVVTVDDVKYALARVKLFNLATPNRWIDTLTAAPHLTLTGAEHCFVPATLIRQRILTCKDTRDDYSNCLWVNWFLTWGPLKYPLEHLDEIWDEHNPF